ncbi:MAG: glycerophosphodiester phosphodiesterase [Myxococcota bacterium]|nr:glycerophosphodiester phosphodiesterase [Myxococcota bacterium]
MADGRGPNDHAVWGARSHRFFDGLQPTLNIAHRGGACLYPENTVLAFDHAVRSHGAHMIETDVHLTADGEVVVIHDDRLERTTNGTGEVAQWTWAELAKLDAGYYFQRLDEADYVYRDQNLRIPRLSDVLAQFPNQTFNIDLKANNPELVTSFVQVIRRHDASHRVCVGSEHDAIGQRLLEALPDAIHFFPRAALIECMTALMGNEPLNEAWLYRVVDVPLTYAGIQLVTPHILERAESAGLWVNVWTIDDEPTMMHLLELKVGGIMTDRPDRLNALLKAAVS